MKVLVHQNRCVASGQCVEAAAEVFDQRDEDGIVVLLLEDPPASMREDVAQAALVCPVQAIEIKD